jgi:hypothetical protein
VTEQRDRKPGVLGPRLVHNLRDVVDDRLYVVDKPALAVGAAVAVMVGGVHDRSISRQAGGDVLVSAAVFAESVHEHHDPLRIGGVPAPDEDRAALACKRDVSRLAHCRAPFLGLALGHFEDRPRDERRSSYMGIWPTPASVTCSARSSAASRGRP